MREFMIDGQRMTSEEAIYIHLNRLFCFPNNFGNNLDALWDVLTEETEATIIHFEYTDALLNTIPEYGKKLIRLFEQLNRRTDNYRVYFYPGEMNHD